MKVKKDVIRYGQFWIEVESYGGQGNLYRAHGPGGMIGDWQDCKARCHVDLRGMMDELSISDHEQARCQLLAKAV